MKKSIYLIFGLIISMTISLNGQVINNQESDKMEGIKRKSSGSKSKRASPDTIHACELDPFLVETIEMAGAQAKG